MTGWVRPPGPAEAPAPVRRARRVPVLVARRTAAVVARGRAEAARTVQVPRTALAAAPRAVEPEPAGSGRTPGSSAAAPRCQGQAAVPTRSRGPVDPRYRVAASSATADRQREVPLR